MNDVLPIFPLGAVLFPGATLSVHVFEARYRRLMKDRLGVDPIFGVALTRKGREVGDEPETYEVGTAASLLAVQPYPDGRFDITVQGGDRFRIRESNWSRGYMTANVEWIAMSPPDEHEVVRTEALRGRLIEEFQEYVRLVEQSVGTHISLPAFDPDAQRAASAICALLPLGSHDQQRLLEVTSPAELLLRLQAVIRRERALLAHTGIGGALPRGSVSFTTN